jgi:hypothetical protein
MSNAIAPVQAPKPPEVSPQHRISGKVRVAIEAMVWQGLNRAQAAEAAGLKDNSLYVAFRRPEVKAHYLRECEVLRTSQRSRNIHRLVEIRDAAENLPAVNAIKTLDPELGMDAERLGRMSNQEQPGLTIIIAPAEPRKPVTIESSPMIPVPQPAQQLPEPEEPAREEPFFRPPRRW